jgi:potassium/chloride transporter 9
MSGDLKHPSKAIPKGTLSGLVLTFIAYTLVILSLASTITRDTFYNNVNVIQDVREYPMLSLRLAYWIVYYRSMSLG